MARQGTAGSIGAMASPPVLFSSAAFFARPLSWTFRLAAECGYRGVEVMVTKDPESQDPAGIRALADEFELEVAFEAEDRPHEHVVGVVVERRPGVGGDPVLAMFGAHGQRVAH